MKIPVFATIGGSFRFFWNHRVQFYYLALPPVVLLAILFAMAGFDWSLPPKLNQPHTFKMLETPDAETIWRSVSGLGAFMIMVIVFPLYSVAWHRSYLIQNEQGTIGSCYRWRWRHWSFLWSMIKISLILLPVFLVGGLFTSFLVAAFPPVAILLMPILIIFVFICYGRFSLWLPAAAVDHKMTLQQVLALTRGNGGRLSVILVLTGLAVGILNAVANVVIAIAAGSLSMFGSLTQSLLTNLALYLIMYAGMAVGISALSKAYKLLIDQEQPAGPAI